MILLVVRKVGWNKSPWDSYTREFPDEKAFVEWWTSQPDDCYAKKVALNRERVKIYCVSMEANDLVLNDLEIYRLLGKGS